MRLIDGDALRAAMYHEAFETDSDMQKWDGGCWIRYKMFENALEAAPTIEAEPVKHGRWYRPEGWPKKTYKRKCTHCQGVAYFCGNGDYMYCPNCGAKMDEEEVETEGEP